MKDVVLVKRSRGIFRRAGGYELALADHKAQRILSVAHAARVREAAGVDGRDRVIFLRQLGDIHAAGVNVVRNAHEHAGGIPDNHDITLGGRRGNRDKLQILFFLGGLLNGDEGGVRFRNFLLQRSRLNDFVHGLLLQEDIRNELERAAFQKRHGKHAAHGGRRPYEHAVQNNHKNQNRNQDQSQNMSEKKYRRLASRQYRLIKGLINGLPS